MKSNSSSSFGIKVFITATALICLNSLPIKSLAWQSTHKSRELVPNAQTAVRIAEAILDPILGSTPKGMKHTLHATRKKTTWVVDSDHNRDPSVKGGDIKLIISAKDARVESIYLGE